MALIRQASRGILRAVNNLNNKPTELVFKTTEPSGVTTYKYDQVDRLTEAVGPTGSFLYQHDGNSNRTKQTINGVDSFFAVDAADQLCHKATTQVACGSAPAGSTTFSYDANGNLTGQSDGRVLTYNAKDQNTSFKAPGAQGLTSTMGYFGAGQAERTDAAGTSFTNGPLGVARTSALLSSTAYVRDPSGTLVSMRGGLAAYYYLFDRLGSVVALTDGAGDVVNRYVYDPYGNPLAGTVEAVVNPWQFAGGLRDAFSGYYKFGQRYYDPTIGRWTQRDPSGQDANSYAYAASCPVNFTDSTGLAAIKSCAAAVFRGSTGLIAVQTSPTGHVTWGAIQYSPFANLGPWSANVYVNGKRKDAKYQLYPPHGSISPKDAPSGSIVRFEITHTDIFGRVTHSVPNACIVP